MPQIMKRIIISAEIGADRLYGDQLSLLYILMLKNGTFDIDTFDFMKM